MWDAGNNNGYRRNTPTPNASINVTSLVDVAFTLLIIFIITAPILQGGIEVELPRAESAPITSSDGVIITVARDGNIYIGEVEVRSSEEFATIFPEYIRDREIRQAYLRGDREVPYGRVLQVLGIMQRLDVVEVGLVSDPEMDRPL